MNWSARSGSVKVVKVDAMSYLIRRRTASVDAVYLANK